VFYEITLYYIGWRETWEKGLVKNVGDDDEERAFV
jgi:hypothetical protein